LTSPLGSLEERDSSRGCLLLFPVNVTSGVDFFLTKMGAILSHLQTTTLLLFFLTKNISFPHRARTFSRGEPIDTYNANIKKEKIYILCFDSYFF
jgi:hypothetical protein